MMYFIERFDANDIQFAESISSCKINKKIYDIIKSDKNSSLESISDHIIDDYYTFMKTNPRETNDIKQFVLKEFNINMNELLLG